MSDKGSFVTHKGIYPINTGYFFDSDMSISRLMVNVMTIWHCFIVKFVLQLAQCQM